VAHIHNRNVPQFVGDELQTALRFLDFQREAMLIKCGDLNEAQLRHVGVPTGTNLLGLVQHLAVSEEYWFHHHVHGAPFDGQFGMDVPESVSQQEVQAAYRSAWLRSNEIIERIGDPAALTVLPVRQERLPLRWVIAHMTTETARHAGHADILREQFDGTTGR
jgi:hypothetical protein